MTAVTDATLRIERTFDCTPEEMWAAWTDPKQVAKWWNPSTAANADADVAEVDAREGGKLRLTMHIPEAKSLFGTDQFPMNGTFATVKPPRELVIKGGGDGGVGEHTIAARFEPVGRRTRVTVEIFGDPGEGYREGMEEGWNLCLDRLATLVNRKEATNR